MLDIFYSAQYLPFLTNILLKQMSVENWHSSVAISETIHCKVYLSII